MSLKRLSRVFGSIFDVAALSEIPDDDCHVIFVSGRTLYLMQHFGNNEVNFLARYADSFSDDGRYYDAVDLDSPNVDLVQRIAQDYRLEVLDMQCTDVIAAIDNLAAQIGLINVALQNSGGCGCGDQTLDPGPLDDQAIDLSQHGGSGANYLTYKCEYSNLIVDKVLYVIREIDAANVDVWLLGGVGGATAILGGLLLAGPAGWTAILALGVVSALLLAVIELGVDDLSDIETVLASHQDDLVCALYDAGIAQEAKDTFLAVLAGQGISAIGLQVVGLMLWNDVLNQLFFETSVHSPVSTWLNDDFTPSTCGATCDGHVLTVFRRLAEFQDDEFYGGSGDISIGSGSRVLSSTLASNGFHYITFRSRLASLGLNAFTFDLTAISLTAGQGAGWATYHWNGSANVVTDEAVGSEPMPTGFYNEGSGQTSVVIIGTVAFTITCNIDFT